MDVGRVAPWARAAGATGVAANVLLAGFFAVEQRRTRLPVSLGSANDVVGSVSSALMIPVVLAVSPGPWTRRLGLTSTVVLTAAGPALVLGLVPFAVQMPIAIGAFEGLAAWILAAGRSRRGMLSDDVARLGVLSGGGVLGGGALVGIGLLLRERSLPRRAALVIGGVPGVLAWLAMPVWFLRLARVLSSDAPTASA